MPEARLKILVVDDYRIDANLTRELLVAMDYDVRVLYDSIRAEEHLKDKTNKYDLLIFDIRMPDIDGITLARRIRDAGINTPIVFVSGEVQNGTKRTLMSMGPTVDFMIKPIEPTVLEQKCTDMLAASSLHVQLGEVKQYLCSMSEKMLTPQHVQEAVEMKLRVHCPEVRKTLLSEVDSRISIQTSPSEIVKKTASDTLAQITLTLALFILASAGYLIWSSHTSATEARVEITEVRSDLKSISQSVIQQSAQIDKLVSVLEPPKSLHITSHQPTLLTTSVAHFPFSTGGGS